jgi:hypothetical protein
MKRNTGQSVTKEINSRNLFQKLQYFHSRTAARPEKKLFERSRDKTMMEGFTDNYIRVTVRTG